MGLSLDGATGCGGYRRIALVCSRCMDRSLPCRGRYFSFTTITYIYKHDISRTQHIELTIEHRHRAMVCQCLTNDGLDGARPFLYGQLECYGHAGRFVGIRACTSISIYMAIANRLCTRNPYHAKITHADLGYCQIYMARAHMYVAAHYATPSSRRRARVNDRCIPMCAYGFIAITI